jgi:hypothetical protein
MEAEGPTVTYTEIDYSSKGSKRTDLVPAGVRGPFSCEQLRAYSEVVWPFGYVRIRESILHPSSGWYCAA